MTTIEWTQPPGYKGETWNPTVGCSKVSPGCDNCYAIDVAHRAMQPAHEGLTIHRPGERPDWTGEVRCLPDRLDTPLTWRNPRCVFVDSMSDLFHPEVPTEFVAKVYAAMVAAPERHIFQVLTKRPKRMARLLATGEFPRMVQREVWALDTHMFAGMVRPNHWWGVSIENDPCTWRADCLRDTPAAVRFLSLEPLLGPLPSLNLVDIDWVIVGGESGPAARPMHPAWVRDIRDRCVDAGVPFFFKQWGAWANTGTGAWIDPEGTFTGGMVPGGALMSRVGKKIAGRELDGRTWDEYPRSIAA